MIGHTYCAHRGQGDHYSRIGRELEHEIAAKFFPQLINLRAWVGVENLAIILNLIPVFPTGIFFLGV